MKKIRLTFLALLMSSMASLAQQTEQLSGSFSCKAKYPSSSNQYLMDSCRVDYMYKTVVGQPAYIANVVWNSRNEFTYRGTKVTSDDVKNYPSLSARFNYIAPKQAKFTYTILFYSKSLNSYILSAKTSMVVDLIEPAGINYGPQIQKSSTWREMFSDVVIGKQELNKIGTVIADDWVDKWIDDNQVRKGHLDPSTTIKGYGSSIRKAFAMSSKIEVVNVEMQLIWPDNDYNILVGSLNNLDNISVAMANLDTMKAADLYFSNKLSLPVVRPNSVDFWNSTVTPYSYVEKYQKEAEKAYKGGDYKTASVYFEKMLAIDSSFATIQARLEKIKNYQEAKAVRNYGDMDLVYVEGNGQIPSFYIGKTEITQRQWRRVMGTNAPNFDNCPDCPVANVTWAEAQEFVSKLSKQTGLKYKLPTEAQWKYAADGGKNATNTEFSGSDNIVDVAWSFYNSDENIHSVAQKTPNELGVYDMTGNVSEWVQDSYDSQKRIAKGGSYADDAANSSNSKMQKFDVNYKSKTVGFRICQDE